MRSFELPDFYVPWPARLNPNLETARAHSKAWARKIGILDASHEESAPLIWSERDFDKHDYALFCAYIHPETPGQELNLMTDWNVWAFYVDDYFLKIYKKQKDPAGAKQYLSRLPSFMPVDLSRQPTPANPTERGLADLWLRTAPSKSIAWRTRIVESTKSLLEESIIELDNMIKQRLANPIEYIEMRRRVGGALWSADLVEHAVFVEIPERIAASRPMQVLKNAFADAVHLRNDIFSYEREVIKEGELTNGVLVIERFLGVDTQRAVHLVNSLLTSRLQQFEHTAVTELEPLFEEYQLDPTERTHVLNYIKGLQDWQSGAHEWHIQTARYLNPESRPSSTLTYRNFLPGLMGSVGTSAARITPVSLGLTRFKNYMHVPYSKVGPTPLPGFYMPFITRPNPNLETARRYSRAWARRMGMLDTLPNQPDVYIMDELKLEAADVAFFCSLAYPDITADELSLAACWLAWATYTDDYFADVFGHAHDMAGARIFHARLSLFMPVETGGSFSIPLNPVERGLMDLWPRTTTALPIEARRRFRRVIENLIGSWLWELSNRIQNRIPDAIDYVEMRRKTSGADFMLTFIRSVQRRGVPDEIFNTRIMQELTYAAGDHIYMINDLVSYQKEIEFEGDINNILLVLQNFMGCDRTQAVEITNHLMTARLQQFEYLVATELPVLFENLNLDDGARKQVIAYIKELQDFIYGSLQWHITVGRYQEFELRRRPGGLGHAMRIPKLAAPMQSTALPSIQTAEVPREIRTFAISHLKPPFQPKAEAQQD